MIPETREAVKSLKVYKPAKNLEKVMKERGLKKIIKLAGNENTLGFSPMAMEAAAVFTSRYPDGQSFNLKAALAEKHSVEVSQIICGNGSFELIFLIALAYLEKSEETILCEPSFNWYKNVTAIMGGKSVSVPVKDFGYDLEGIKKAVTEKTKIIWICNPNNPTGTIIRRKEMEEFLESIPENVLVVLDEAYVDFCVDKEFPDSFELLKKHPNILILRTFSKLEGLAFFRVGYAVGNESVIENLAKVRLPINVTGPAQNAAIAALKDKDFIEKSRTNILNGLEQYYRAFDEWGLKYVKSHANFIFVDIGTDSSGAVEYLEENGVLVRGGAEFGFPSMLRISIGIPEENQLVIDLLKKYLKK